MGDNRAEKLKAIIMKALFCDGSKNLLMKILKFNYLKNL